MNDRETYINKQASKNSQDYPGMAMVDAIALAGLQYRTALAYENKPNPIIKEIESVYDLVSAINHLTAPYIPDHVRAYVSGMSGMSTKKGAI